MGAAFRSEYMYDYNDDDESITTEYEQFDKACQTDYSLPVNDVNFIIESKPDAGQILTNISLKKDDEFISKHSLIERDKELELMHEEIEFLKAELHGKQDTIENLLELLKSNLDVTKEISRGITSNASDMNDYDNITLINESDRNAQRINDWKLNTGLYGQLATLDTSDFDDSLNSRFTSSTNSYDIFIDSLEVDNKR